MALPVAVPRSAAKPRSEVSSLSTYTSFIDKQVAHALARLFFFKQVQSNTFPAGARHWFSGRENCSFNFRMPPVDEVLMANTEENDDDNDFDYEEADIDIEQEVSAGDLLALWKEGCCY